MKNLLLALGLIFTLNAFSFDRIWFDCTYKTQKNDILLIYTLDTDANGVTEVVVQNLKSQKIYAKSQIISSSNSSTNYFALKVFGTEFGNIVLTYDYENLYVHGLFSLTPKGIISPEFNSLRLMMNEERVIPLDCAIE